jgi:hypothetical protein
MRPAAHSLQALMPTALYWPPGHSLHAVACWYFPAGHSLHALASLALYWPAEHRGHEMAPLALYRPLEQPKQLSPPVSLLWRPAGQTEHDAALDTEY